MRLNEQISHQSKHRSREGDADRVGGAIVSAFCSLAAGWISILGRRAWTFHVVAPSRFLMRTKL